jgi:hypothetical protein
MHLPRFSSQYTVLPTMTIDPETTADPAVMLRANPKQALAFSWVDWSEQSISIAFASNTMCRA